MNHDGTTNTTADDGDQQRWIDELLRSSAAAELEAAPAGVKFATAAAIGKLRRRQMRQRSVAVFAAAAAMAAVWAWPESPLPRREGATEHGRPKSTERRAVDLAERSGEGLHAPVIAQTPGQPPSAGNPFPSPRGIYVDNGDAIAVALDSPAPNVTVVQLYSTTTAQRRAQNEFVLRQLLTTEPNGG